MTELANMLRIVDGEFVCVDGSDVKEYLRANPVCVIGRSELLALQEAANFMKGWPA